VRQDERAPFQRALQRARVAAYAPGEFAGQESFMTAGEIRALAVQAGIGPGVSVLDLCCGTAGPGCLITRELGCDYLGVDYSATAIALARERAGQVPCRFAVAHVPPLPAGAFDVVLLLETLLAFPDKDALVREIAAALRPVRVHARGGAAAHGGRAGGDARRRHGLAHAADRAGGVPRRGRPRRHLE
jgi:SAM-dependent methyltransferase